MPASKNRTVEDPRAILAAEFAATNDYPVIESGSVDRGTDLKEKIDLFRT
jgi:hypothetical protein